MILSRDIIEQYEQWHEIAREKGAFALIDKDLDWTSMDVVAKMRNVTRIKKVGHAGTLDPLATGLLILGFGRAAKRLSEFMDKSKTYRGSVRLGAATKTDDSEAEEENVKDVSHISEKILNESVKKFVGKILQKPPAYSARKVKGQRMYRLARKNVKVEGAPAEVEVHRFEILNIDLPYVEIEVECEKGVFIRSLARDLGNELDVGGYLASLRRTKIGGYDVSNALKIDEITKKIAEKS